MVRYCAVPHCTSNDTQILSHRFPRNLKLAKEWRDALELHDISVDELVKRYVVCTKHFERSAYRNTSSNYLNFTAVPKLGVTINNIQTERNAQQIDAEHSDGTEETGVDLNIIHEDVENQLEDDDNGHNEIYDEVHEIFLNKYNCAEEKEQTIKQNNETTNSNNTQIETSCDTSQDDLKFKAQTNKPPKEYRIRRQYLPDLKRKHQDMLRKEPESNTRLKLLKRVVVQSSSDDKVKLDTAKSNHQISNTNTTDARICNERERLNLLSKEELIEEVLQARKLITEIKHKLCTFLNE